MGKHTRWKPKKPSQHPLDLPTKIVITLIVVILGVLIAEVFDGRLHF